jgi:DNA gyrase/topoisomerase IV subunit B
MAITIKQTHEKEIIALSQFEAIRLRPGMYIGPVSMIDEKIPIIRNGKLQLIEKTWSPGFRHLLVEILENSIDEAKRMHGKMSNLFVIVNLDNNTITVKDTGGGFHKAHTKHSKTKKNIVRTAMEDLHAGSNFTDSSTSILGTHGVGAAVVNVLSSEFGVTTINKTHCVKYVWKDFHVTTEEIRLKTSKDELGTTVWFKPSEDVFANFKWDKELINTYLSFKSFLISQDPIIKNLKLVWSFVEGGLIKAAEITENFLPEDTISIKNKLGTIFLWPAYENSTSISFINGSHCTGIHQKIVNDWGNEYFGYALAHHFYNTLVTLDVPSTLMRFGDQNKSKYDVTRFEIEDLMVTNFKSKLLRALKGSDLSKKIFESIEDRLYDENMKKIKRAQKTSKRKISDKYSPASKHKKNIFLTEGLCIEENQKIFIIRKNKILYKCLKDVKISDLVITHNNNLKPITHINKSIKHGLIIKNSLGEDIICAKDHKWFVYDPLKKEFYFEKACNLTKNHKLVKNYLVFLESFDEIVTINFDNDKIEINNNKNEIWKITKNNKICIFDELNNKFIMINSNDLKKGNLICKFNTI